MLRGHDCQLETIGFEEASYVLQININSHKLTEINIKEVFYFNKKGLYGKNVYYLHLKKGAISSNILEIVLIFCRKSRIFSLNAVWLVAYKRSNGLTFMLFTKNLRRDYNRTFPANLFVLYQTLSCQKRST